MDPLWCKKFANYCQNHVCNNFALHMKFIYRKVSEVPADNDKG